MLHLRGCPTEKNSRTRRLKQANHPDHDFVDLAMEQAGCDLMLPTCVVAPRRSSYQVACQEKLMGVDTWPFPASSNMALHPDRFETLFDSCILVSKEIDGGRRGDHVGEVATFLNE